MATKSSPAKESARKRVEKDRRQFLALTMSNPNYFGNFQESPFEAVKSMTSNTTYEALTCVGYHPQMRRLSAVVALKQDTGYGGGLCSDGSLEYVRFYLSTDNGVTWDDQGMLSFRAHDIPGDKPLLYSLSLDVSPHETWCKVENLILVRAILSWNQPIPANMPNFLPVYGNVLEAHIQVAPRKAFVLGELLEAFKVTLPKEWVSMLDVEQTLAMKPPAPLPVHLRAKAYQDKGVPAHRYLFPELMQSGVQPMLNPEALGASLTQMFTEWDIDLAAVIAKLMKTDGDTRYEELLCVGLNPHRNRLEAVFKTKLPNGYSGNLCSSGSQEYVAFWVDWGDGAGWTYAGTSAVNVHDVAHMPADGLFYMASVPVELSAHRRPCAQGAVTARVRAILSWETPPPAGNPNFVPTWGNREERLVHIMPGAQVPAHDHSAYLESVGNMAVCDINHNTGLASGHGILANFVANQAPFGGTVTITGYILNPPNSMAGAPPFRYRIWVRQLSPVAGAWQPLSNDFDIVVTEQNGVGIPVQHHQTQSIDSNGYYTYLEQAYPNQWREVAGNVLARWHTSAPMDGLWELRMEVLYPDGTHAQARTPLCVGGASYTTVRVRVDNKRPNADLTITGFVRQGVTYPAGACGTFRVGDIIQGTYQADDIHFGHTWFILAPSAQANGASVHKTPVVLNFHQEQGTWELDTSVMDPCGYTVFLYAIDRTIINSGAIGWRKSQAVGFCLRPAHVEPGTVHAPALVE